MSITRLVSQSICLLVKMTKENRRCLVFILVILALISLPYAAMAGKTKVFILAGQSNMQNKGKAEHLDAFIDDPKLGPKIKVTKSGSDWKVRDDVELIYNNPNGKSQLTVKGRIGPEFGFGHCVGEALKDDVLLIKCAWGGKTLVRHFRPPSAGGTVGPFYEKMISIVHESLKSVGSYEIVGFVWFQGYNDMVARTPADTYCELMVHLLTDLRTEFKTPNMFLVTGGMGHGGVSAKDGNVNEGQQAFVAKPEFKSTTRYVPTKQFWNEEAAKLFGVWRRDSKAFAAGEAGKRYAEIACERPYHYNGCGEFFFQTGWALGEAILELMEISAEPTVAARKTGRTRTPRPKPKKPKAEAVTSLDKKLLVKLTTLSESGGLPEFRFKISKSRASLRLEKASAAGTLTFSANDKTADIEFSELNYLDRAVITIALIRGEPENKALCGCAAFYLDCAGRSSHAQKYYTRAGSAVSAKIQTLFDE